MRVVIEQRHGVRRELLIMLLVVLFGAVTVALLLLPGLFG